MENDEHGTDHGTVHQNTSAARLFAGEFGEVSRVDVEFAGTELGLGVLENLAGEVISLDSHTYAIPVSGIPYLLEHHEGLAFAISARGGKHYPLELSTAALNQTSLLTAIDALINEHHENPDNIVATIRLHACLSHIRLRTVTPPQSPSEDLNSVMAHEIAFEFTDWEGTLVGFRFPDNHSAHADPTIEAVDGSVISGLHLHGISDARDSGGHVHEFEISHPAQHAIQLTVTLDELDAIPGSA